MRRSSVRLLIGLAVMIAATPANAVRLPGPAAAVPSTVATSAVAATGSPGITVVAAGDIACDPLHPSFNGGRGIDGWCRARATAREVTRLAPDAVLALGDEQYDDGRGAAFRASYDDSWGAFRDLTYPVPGNHEYWSDAAAAGYFGYFGDRAGPPGQGWYSLDVGAWHLVALNSNCDRVACEPGSPQYRWLRADLIANPTACTLAFLHHPLTSSGPHGDDAPIGSHPLWRALYLAGVDVALAGHDHLYERFAPLRPDLSKDVATGIRTFVVGTGGVQHYPVVTRKNYSQAVDATSFGVLRLSLRPRTYRWRFAAAAGASFTDVGSGSCHGAPAV